MSLADELLDSLDEDQVATHNIDPSIEPHIIINEDKTIIVPDELKHIAVEGEHNIETVTFDCPRYWDEHDLSEMSMRINYQRPDGHREPHPVENLMVDDANPDMIHFDWTISGNVTAVKGTISFMVCAKLTDEEGIIEREWHSRLNQDLVIDAGLDCSGREIVERNPDVLESILFRLETIESTGGNSSDPSQNGKDGFSPVATVQQTADGAVITITDKDGTTTATITNGKDGVDGQDGKDGYTPQKGIDYFDGQPGKDGSDGVSATHSWNGTVLTITSASGTSSADLKGAKGDKGDSVKGDPGSDGVSPTVAVSKSGKVTTVSITDKNGTKTATINDGADGTPGKTPVKGTDYFTVADKAEMVEDVKASMDGIPSYWQTALDNGVEAINTALCEAGRNKSAFLFYSDSHWNYGSQMAPTLLKYLHNHTGMVKTFFGGDIVNDEASDYDTMKYLWEWRKQLKDLPNHHSVVGNHDDGNSTNDLFSEQYVYGYLLAVEETPNMVMGDGLYYYVDSFAEKTRYLCLDTAYKGVDSAQQEFVKDALLNTPNGWHIVAISHIWHDTNYNVTPPAPGAINSSASTLLSMFEAYNSRNGDYADCTGWVEFCIGGHTHWDYDSASALGIPIILVETDSQHTRSGLTFTAGTTTEASVNGIIADYDANTIKVVRIGRGASREVEMTWFETSYTNLIPTATDTDGATIYNGVGYKENIRLSGSSGSFRDNTGSDCTGYIKTPVGEAFTVYMKNITANTNDNYGFAVSLLKGTGVAQTDGCSYSNVGSYYSPVYDDDGNVIQFTVTADKAHGYMVISAVNIDSTSIITINEPIG